MPRNSSRVDGVFLWENHRDDGELTQGTLLSFPSTHPLHGTLRSGDAHLWIRKQKADGSFGDATIVRVDLQPRPYDPDALGDILATSEYYAKMQQVAHILGVLGELQDFLEHHTVFDPAAPTNEREQLIDAIQTNVENDPDLMAYLLQTILFIEVDTEQSGGGRFFCGSMRIETTPDPGIVAHEFHHAFARINNPVACGGAVDEGFGVILGQLGAGNPLADTGEAVFGTKLYYRDVIGNPDFPWGPYIYSGTPTPALLDLVDLVMARDMHPGEADYRDLDSVTSRFDSHWVCRNRNMDFQEWLTTQVAPAHTTPCP